MELAGLEVTLGQSVPEWLVNVKAWSMTVCYCRLYKHCTLWLQLIYKRTQDYITHKRQ